MTARTLFIHIGHAKTGTSSLQATCRHSQNVLKQAGLFYPRIGTHKRIADHFLGSRDHSAELARIRHYSRKRDPQLIILSSEFLNTLDRAQAEAMVETFRPLAKEIKVIMYARHPAGFATSAIQQQMRRPKVPLRAAMEAFVPFRFKKRLEIWPRLVGKENVIVREFHRSKLKNGDIIADFFEVIGHADLANNLTRIDRNEALSLLGVGIADKLAPMTKEPLLYSRVLGRIAGAKFYLPQPFLDQVVEAGRGEVAYLAREWGIELTPPEPTPDDLVFPLGDDVLASLAEALYLSLERPESVVPAKLRMTAA